MMDILREIANFQREIYLAFADQIRSEPLPQEVAGTAYLLIFRWASCLEPYTR